MGKILWRRKWQYNPVFLPGKFRGQRSLVGRKSVRHGWMTECLSDRILDTELGVPSRQDACTRGTQSWEGSRQHAGNCRAEMVSESERVWINKMRRAKGSWLGYAKCPGSCHTQVGQPASLKRWRLCWDLGEETRGEMGQGFLSRATASAKGLRQQKGWRSMLCVMVNWGCQTGQAMVPDIWSHTSLDFAVKVFFRYSYRETPGLPWRLRLR